MSLYELRIEPQQGKRGRSFSALCAATVSANALWDSGTVDRDIARPVFAVFLGSEEALQPFIANLMLGRRAVTPDGGRHSRQGIEFLRSSGVKVIWQREAEGAIATVFLPELFLLDPGMVDPKVVQFVLLPPTKWAAAQTLDVAQIVAHAQCLPLVETLNAPPVVDRRWRHDSDDEPHEPLLTAERLAALVPTAYLFAAYLDRRSRAPIVPDGRFYLQMLLACLRAGLATFGSDSPVAPFGVTEGHGKFQQNVVDAGFCHGVAFRATHDALEALLAEEAATYFAVTSDDKTAILRLENDRLRRQLAARDGEEP